MLDCGYIVELFVCVIRGRNWIREGSVAAVSDMEISHGGRYLPRESLPHLSSTHSSPCECGRQLLIG